MPPTTCSEPGGNSSNATHGVENIASEVAIKVLGYIGHCVNGLVQESGISIC